MRQFSKLFSTAILLFASTSLFASITVKDEKGELTLDKAPERIVALEYSFVDALANVGITPVGVADDNDKTRILASVREKIGEWKSVGTRSQPSLEVIAELKPELIIADVNRHSAVYDELKKIAPVLLLKSQRKSYHENLASAETIGQVVGKGEEMAARLKAHKANMAEIASALPKGDKVVFGVSRENQFFFYTTDAYTGELLAELGLSVEKPRADMNDAKSEGFYTAGLEQLVSLNPDWLLVAHYRDESLARKWAEEPLWKALTAVKADHVKSVEPNLWARARGIDAAEAIATEVKNLLTTK